MSVCGILLWILALISDEIQICSLTTNISKIILNKLHNLNAKKYLKIKRDAVYMYAYSRLNAFFFYNAEHPKPANISEGTSHTFLVS